MGMSVRKSGEEEKDYYFNKENLASLLQLPLILITLWHSCYPFAVMIIKHFNDFLSILARALHSNCMTRK
jgi:hypothetical protein